MIKNEEEETIGITTVVVAAVRPLKPKLQEIANKELNEAPHRVIDDINTLRLWVLQQSHLRGCTDNQFLLAFLRGTKFSLERAKQKYEKFYTMQSSISEVFNEHRLADDPMVLDVIRQGILLRIPLDENATGPCVSIIRAGSYDTKKYKFQDIIRVGSMFGEIMMLEDDNATVSGYVEIMDMRGVTATHLFALQPDLLRKFSSYADEAMPTRQKGIHFINVPTAFEKGFNTLRTFFPEKIRNRVSVNSNPDAIFKIIPRENLPLEYGGTRGTSQDISQNMEEKIQLYHKYFIESRNYGITQKSTPKMATTTEAKKGKKGGNYGITGSFRKLEID